MWVVTVGSVNRAIDLLVTFENRYCHDMDMQFMKIGWLFFHTVFGFRVIK